MGEPDGEKDVDYIKATSDSLRDGVAEILSAFIYAIRGFWEWSDNHPFLRLLILAPVSAIVSSAVFRVLGSLYSLFYGSAVPISSDIMLQTLPLPVGLSIYLLFTLWLLTTVTAYLRLVELRERVDEIEST
jgi:hypothetical protein